MAKRGPKPKKVHDPEKLKAALKRGIKHGGSLYAYGCRCKICTKAKRDARRKYVKSISLEPIKKKAKIYHEDTNDPKYPLPVGLFNRPAT